MKPTLERYLDLLDVLRLHRGRPEWKPEQDREILATLEDWYVDLGEIAQAQIESNGWRAWPEPEAPVDRSLDPAADGAVQAPPRVRQA